MIIFTDKAACRKSSEGIVNTENLGRFECKPGCEKENRMKILVGLDGSNTSEAALQLAIRTANAYNADLLVITSMATGTTDENDEIRNAKKGLEEAEVRAQQAGVSCSTHLLIRGKTVGEDIVAFAAENAIDLIVVGVKRRSRVGKILMGSNAQFVIIKAGCPVLTVK